VQDGSKFAIRTGWWRLFSASCRISNPKSSRLESAEQIPRVVRRGALARDADARRIVGSRLESAEYIPGVLSLGALAPVAQCLLGKRDGDARRTVDSLLERGEHLPRIVRLGGLATSAK
jgi:hypothetical protein